MCKKITKLENKHRFAQEVTTLSSEMKLILESWETVYQDGVKQTNSLE